MPQVGGLAVLCGAKALEEELPGTVVDLDVVLLLAELVAPLLESTQLVLHNFAPGLLQGPLSRVELAPVRD